MVLAVRVFHQIAFELISEITPNQSCVVCMRFHHTVQNLHSSSSSLNLSLNFGTPTSPALAFNDKWQFCGLNDKRFRMEGADE